MTAVPQRTRWPRIRRTLRNVSRHRRVLSPSPNISSVHDGSSGHGSNPGLANLPGSLMAAGKLQEILPQRPITYKGQNIVNLVFMLIAVGSAGHLVVHPGATHLFR